MFVDPSSDINLCHSANAQSKRPSSGVASAQTPRALFAQAHHTGEGTIITRQRATFHIFPLSKIKEANMIYLFNL